MKHDMDKNWSFSMQNKTQLFASLFALNITTLSLSALFMLNKISSKWQVANQNEVEKQQRRKKTEKYMKNRTRMKEKTEESCKNKGLRLPWSTKGSRCVKEYSSRRNKAKG